MSWNNGQGGPIWAYADSRGWVTPAPLFANTNLR